MASIATSAGYSGSLPRRRFDVVIVGAGGSGMRASLQLAQAGLNVAVLGANGVVGRHLTPRLVAAGAATP